jgi:DNA-binding IclR family transcriptional regulator
MVFAPLDGNGEMTAAAIATAAEIDVTALRPLLRQLVDAGTVEQTGRGGGTRYRLATRG